MMASLHHHNDDEEIKDLPLLEPAIGTDASKEAALSFKKTKKLVPTRRVASIPTVLMRTQYSPVTSSQGTPFYPQQATSGDFAWFSGGAD